MTQIVSNINEAQTIETKVLIGAVVGQDKKALTIEQYQAQQSAQAVGIILRGASGLDHIFALADITAKMSLNGEDIPDTDPRREEYNGGATFSCLDGEMNTELQKWNHVEDCSVKGNAVAQCCAAFGGEGWMPSAGELSALMANGKAVDEALAACGGEALSGDGVYGSSSQYEAEHQWVWADGQFEFWHARSELMLFRACGSAAAYLEAE